ncbi:hypothetical protein MRX96_027996 [Rhipicephalus microplus]
MAYELRFHVIQVVLVWLPLVVHSRRPVDTPAKQLQFPEDCGVSTDPSACADTPELSRSFGKSSSSETSFLSSNKSGNSERQWFSGRGGSTTVARAYELRFHVIQVVLALAAARGSLQKAWLTPLPNSCSFQKTVVFLRIRVPALTHLSFPGHSGNRHRQRHRSYQATKAATANVSGLVGVGGSTTVARAYELRFHVIQVVLVWLPLVVHSRRPVDTPAKQLQFPQDCGFSTDPSACADTPELSRPFGKSSSSETSFLSSNKSGNSERQWFSGRGGSTTVARAYELRFHVMQVVLVWLPLVVSLQKAWLTPLPNSCSFQKTAVFFYGSECLR